MILKNLELSDLLIAKFSHDLAGPIGAINNGTEFLKEEDMNMREKANELIEISAKQAVARLHYFRNAYGIVSDSGEANLNEIRSLINNYLYDSKLSLNWTDDNINVSGFSINHKIGKIILNEILIVCNALIYGGSIEVKLLKTTNGKRIIITGTGKNIKLDEETSNILNQNYERVKLTPRNIQIYYLSSLISETNVKFNVDKQDDHITLILDL